MSWPSAQLGDVAEFLDHMRRPIRQADRTRGSVPYYGANGQQDSVEGWIFDEPLVLLPEDGGHFDAPQKGIAYRISGRSWVNNHAHVLRAKPSVDTDYLFRVLEHRDVTPYISGTTRGKLTKASAARISIPLPPLAEQKRLAQTLEHIEELRFARRRSVDLLEEALRSELYNATRHAKRVPLGDIAIRITDGTHQAPMWSASGIPFLFVSNLTGGAIDFRTLKFVSPDTHAELTRSVPIEVGDVLYTAVGSYGTAALVQDDRKFVFQRHIAQIKPDHSLVDARFLTLALNSSDVKRQADRVARGVAQKTMTLGEIAKLQIPYPALGEQRRIALIKKGAESLGQQMQAHDRLLTELFESTKARFFGGGSR